MVIKKNQIMNLGKIVKNNVFFSSRTIETYKKKKRKKKNVK